MTVIGEQIGKKPCVAAIGFFDGVHVGHRRLIDECLRVAKEKGLVPTVLTFDASSS